MHTKEARKTWETVPMLSLILFLLRYMCFIALEIGELINSLSFLLTGTFSTKRFLSWVWNHSRIWSIGITSNTSLLHASYSARLFLWGECTPHINVLKKHFRRFGCTHRFLARRFQRCFRFYNLLKGLSENPKKNPDNGTELSLCVGLNGSTKFSRKRRRGQWLWIAPCSH